MVQLLQLVMALIDSSGFVPRVLEREEEGRFGEDPGKEVVHSAVSHLVIKIAARLHWERWSLSLNVCIFKSNKPQGILLYMKKRQHRYLSDI